VSEFVDECRREWRRLGVPDPIANEMAADLTADLDEAEAEGGSAEDVLGNSAFDPRRFAAAWAGARGVTSPQSLENPVRAETGDRWSGWRVPAAIALTAVLGLLTVLGAAALLIGQRSASVAVATGRIFAGPGSLLVPGPRRMPIGPLGHFVGTRIVGVDARPFALLVFVIGIVGLGLLAVLYWSPWLGARRNRPRDRVGSPGWN
jgi:hypothetical protein